MRDVPLSGSGRVFCVPAPAIRAAAVVMVEPGTVEQPGVGTAEAVRMEDMYQVVLHNDEHNTMDFVVGCLQRVFGHSVELAMKIMAEAHRRGRAIAEVEAETPARTHRAQLQSFGLMATVERI